MASSLTGCCKWGAVGKESMYWPAFSLEWKCKQPTVCSCWVLSNREYMLRVYVYKSSFYLHTSASFLLSAQISLTLAMWLLKWHYLPAIQCTDFSLCPRNQSAICNIRTMFNAFSCNGAKCPKDDALSKVSVENTDTYARKHCQCIDT